MLECPYNSFLLLKPLNLKPDYEEAVSQGLMAGIMLFQKVSFIH